MKKCPKCGEMKLHKNLPLNALSRRDNKTYICTDCGYSWAFAIQDLLTFALKRAEGDRDLKLIAKSVMGQFCNAMPVNQDHAKSCVDAISQVLKKEFLQ